MTIELERKLEVQLVPVGVMIKRGAGEKTTVVSAAARAGLQLLQIKAFA